MAMEMKINLSLKMTQKLVMTPMLQQAIKLLPMGPINKTRNYRKSGSGRIA